MPNINYIPPRTASNGWSLGNQGSSNNPYSSGITIPGTGANNSSTDFPTLWDSSTNTWGINQGADGAIAPIYTNQQWASRGQGLGGNESFNGNTLDIANKGGGSTDVGYSQDPKTGYWIPSSSQGVGQDSWWQSTGLPILGTAAAIGAAAWGAPELLGAMGGGSAAAGAGVADAGLGAAGAGISDSALAGSFAGAQAGADATLGSAGLSSFDIAGADAAAGGAGMSQGSLSSLWGSSGLGGSPSLSSGGFDSGYGSMMNGASDVGSFGGNSGGPATMWNTGSTMGGTMDPTYNVSNMTDGSGNLLPATGSGGGTSNWGQIGQGLGQLAGPLSSLYNSYSGNKANQNISSNLMGMYTNAQNLSQPSVNQVNQTIQNPNSYFSSPLYQSQANLYGNNVDAQKNASGTAGNGIDYTQKMMGFAGQNYDNYVNTIGGQAQGFLGNQAKYGQDYAFGTALGNTSGAASNASMLNTGLGSLGSAVSGLGSLYSGVNGLTGGSLGNSLSSAFSSIF
jgi:hypothetical protein